MGLRHGLLASFSLVALRRPPGRRRRKKLPAPPSKAAASAAHAALTGVPRTLAEALAMTYSNQPALQAERAKLRATDENVPTALAGWRPTVMLAGSTGMAMAYRAPIRRPCKRL